MVQMLISIKKPIELVILQGGGIGPPTPFGSAHTYDRSTCDIQIFKSSGKPILRDMFSHAMVHFPSVTSKHSLH